MSRFFRVSLLAPVLALPWSAAPAAPAQPSQQPERLAIAALHAAQNAPAAAGPGLTLTTTAFEDGGIIPNQYTQAVSSPISPPLEWSHVPAGTVSFALIIDDPDSALRHTPDEVLHWLIFNIPASSTSLPENVPHDATLPDGAMQAKNTGGVVGFRGPGAPAAGPYHHYLFQLYALDTKLSLGPDTTRQDFLQASSGHVLGKGVLVGRFHR
jgi:Raf kinase inhibitor-like YbhB/YbcL family protein